MTQTSLEALPLNFRDLIGITAATLVPREFDPQTAGTEPCDPWLCILVAEECFAEENLILPRECDILESEVCDPDRHKLMKSWIDPAERCRFNQEFDPMLSAQCNRGPVFGESHMPE